MNTQKRLRWYNDYETETIREVWEKEKQRERERERERERLSVSDSLL